MSSWWHIVCCDSWIPVHHTSITDPWSSYNKICFNFCILRCFCSIKRLGQIWEGNRSLLGPNYLISSDWTFTLGKTLGIVHGAIRGGGGLNLSIKNTWAAVGILCDPFEKHGWKYSPMVTIKDNHQYTESLPKDTLRSLRQKKAKHRLNYLDTNPKGMYGGNLAVRITTLLSTQWWILWQQW